MSEIKTLDVEVSFPNALDVDVDFGQTLTKIVAPEHYMGPFEFYASDEDQVIPVKDKTPAEDICVKGADGTLEITKNGTYDVVGKKSVVVNNPEEWTTAGIATKTEPNGDIDLGNLTEIADYAFYKSSITSVVGRYVTKTYDAAFAHSAELRSISLPQAISIGNGLCISCSSLEEVHLPRAANLVQSMFNNCNSLKTLYLPSVKDIAAYSVMNSENLEVVIFAGIRGFGKLTFRTFENTPKLRTLVLGSYDDYTNTRIPETATGVFQKTNYSEDGEGGDIYIPKKHYDHLGDGSNLDYLANSVWATIYGWGKLTFKQIEGSEYETYMPGGEKYNEEMALTV